MEQTHYGLSLSFINYSKKLWAKSKKQLTEDFAK